MYFSVIKFSKEFSSQGLKTWIGGEVTLSPDENEFEAYKKLKSFANTAFYGEKVQPIETIPEPYLTDEQLPQIPVEKSDRERESTIQVILDEITGSTTIAELTKNQIYLKTYPEVKHLYDSVYKELSTPDK